MPLVDIHIIRDVFTPGQKHALIEKVTEAMREKARLVDEATDCLLAGRKAELGPIMSRDFDLRRSVYNLSPENIKMIEIARGLGTHAKFTGSGGAAVGTYESDEHFRRLEEAYGREGYAVIRAVPVEQDPSARGEEARRREVR